MCNVHIQVLYMHIVHADMQLLLELHDLSELHDEVEEGGVSLGVGGEGVRGLQEVLHGDPLTQPVVETLLPH